MSGDQPGIVKLAGGGFAMVWTEGTGSGRDVLAQIFGANGDVTISQFQVNPPNVSFYVPDTEPSIAALPSGSFVVTWKAIENGVAALYQQVFSVNGAPLSDIPTKVNTLTAFDADSIGDPVVTAIPGEGWITTFTMKAAFGATGADVYQRRFDSNGKPLNDTEFKINDPNGAVQDTTPSVTALDNGDVVVTWRSKTDVSDSILQRLVTKNLSIGVDDAIGTKNAENLIISADTFTAGDTIDGGASADGFLLSGPGTYDFSSAAIINMEGILGSTGDDTLVFAVKDLGWAKTIDGGSGQDRFVLAAPGIYNFSLSSISNMEAILGSEGGDTIILKPADLAWAKSIDLGGGTDTLALASAGTFDLSVASLAGVEKLQGSAGADVITGTAAQLQSFASVDLGAGTDTLALATAGTFDLSVASLAGVEKLQGSAGADVIIGTAAQLQSFAFIDLGGGTDTLALASEGTFDLSVASLAGVEQLQGSAGADVIIGTAAQILSFASVDGGAGSDTLAFTLAGTIDLRLPTTFTGIERVSGSAGSDVLIGNAARLSALSSVAGGAGTDKLVLTGGGTFDFRGDVVSVETIAVSGALTTVVMGTAARDTVVGGTGRDLLDGQSGNDILNGGLGKDDLRGGIGKDAFLFTTKLSSTNIDVVRDFRPVDDVLRLENAIFKGIGSGSATKPLKMLAGALVFGSAAQDADDRIIYNKANGALFYDPDGIGGKAQIKFAVLTNKPALTLSDFYVI